MNTVAGLCSATSLRLEKAAFAVLIMRAFPGQIPMDKPEKGAYNQIHEK
jgi:hypothetical protein